MANVALEEFIDQNSDELVRRCRIKVAKRQSPPAEAEIDGGVRLLLSQISDELRHGPSQNDEITQGATRQ